MTLGRASNGFLSSPAKIPTGEFFAIVFLIIAASLYWARWMNKLAG